MSTSVAKVYSHFKVSSHCIMQRGCLPVVPTKIICLGIGVKVRGLCLGFGLWFFYIFRHYFSDLYYSEHSITPVNDSRKNKYVLDNIISSYIIFLYDELDHSRSRFFISYKSRQLHSLYE